MMMKTIRFNYKGKTYDCPFDTDSILKNEKILGRNLNDRWHLWTSDETYSMDINAEMRGEDITLNDLTIDVYFGGQEDLLETLDVEVLVFSDTIECVSVARMAQIFSFYEKVSELVLGSDKDIIETNEWQMAEEFYLLLNGELTEETRREMIYTAYRNVEEIIKAFKSCIELIFQACSDKQFRTE